MNQVAEAVREKIAIIRTPLELARQFLLEARGNREKAKASMRHRVASEARLTAAAVEKAASDWVDTAAADLGDTEGAAQAMAFIRRELAEHKGDSAAAAEAIREKLSEQPELARQLADANITCAIARVASVNRKRIIARAESVDTSRKSSLRLIEAMRGDWYAGWSVNGKDAMDANDEDYRASIGRLTSTIKSDQKRVRIETAILKRMKPGKRCRDCMTAEQFEKIVREAV